MLSPAENNRQKSFSVLLANGAGEGKIGNSYVIVTTTLFLRWLAIVLLPSATASAAQHDERAAAHLIPVHVAAPSAPTVVMQAPPAQNPRHSTRSTEKKTGLIEIDLGGGRRVCAGRCRAGREV